MVEPIAATKATTKVTRAPYTICANISCPSPVVPKICDKEGGRDPLTILALGSYGVRSGAAMAIRTKKTTTATPKAIFGFENIAREILLARFLVLLNKVIEVAF